MDAKAFDAFYEASFASIVGQIYAMCGNFTEAQECVQEAFVRAWDHRRELDRDQSPEAWVRTVAWRVAVSRWRKAKRLVGPPSEWSSLLSPSEPPDADHVALIAALKQIPAEHRRAVVLHHICDLSVADVAHETGAAVGTVKARLSRGRAALAKLLEHQTEGTFND